MKSESNKEKDYSQDFQPHSQHRDIRHGSWADRYCCGLIPPVIMRQTIPPRAGVWVQGVQSSLEVTIAGISVGLLLGPLAGVRLLDTGNASLSPELSSKRKVPYWVVGFDGKWGFSCFYPLGLSCLYVSSRRHISIQILWFSVHTASQRKAPHFLQIIVSKMAPQLYLQKAPKGRPLLLCGAVYNITSGPQGNVATYTPTLLWNEFPD